MIAIAARRLTGNNNCVHSSATPLGCEERIRTLTLHDLNPIAGKWIFIEGTTNAEKYGSVLERVNSSWVEFLPTSENNTSIFRQRNKISSICQYSEGNLTLVNNTFSIVQLGVTYTGVMLSTCSDCLLLSFSSFDSGETLRSLYIFGRERILNATELKTYRTQAECLGLPDASYKYDGNNELCPPPQEDPFAKKPSEVNTGHE
nr:uncharacterized protein LOC111847305 [Paramormyrops kingsleyae]